MIVLARKPGQVIRFKVGDEEITVKVIDVKGTIVRFGVEADREVKVAKPDEEVPQV